MAPPAKNSSGEGGAHLPPNFKMLPKTFLRCFLLIACVAFVADHARAQVPSETASGPVDEVRAQLLSSLAGELTAHFSAEGDLQLELSRPWQPVSGKSGETNTGLAVKLTEFPAALSSTLLLRVRVTEGSQPPREESVLCRAQLWRDAWVAQTPADRGESFDPGRCDVRRIDALRERDAIPASFVNSTDWSYLRPVSAGRLLTWRDISRRALVRKGQVIDVSALDGSLQVNLKALAMQDGGKGETVRVRNIESRREFAALVVGENRAQVNF
ncbi:MAG: flagellar basal body P-ring formation protein FlgA [Opitutaceae bacterium]|nr:flagellar basal body P-ring formation protein FlgA [Opitutaceae bacterium]